MQNIFQLLQVLKQLELLAQHKFDDEDITADIEFLNESLQTSIQDLRYVSFNLNLVQYIWDDLM